LDFSQCVCLSPYQWYWNTTSLVGSCICNTTFSAITAGGCINCTALLYATGAVINKVCQCYTNFLWSNTNYTCYCPSSFNFNSNLQTCTCPVTSAIIGGVCVNCLTINHNNGSNTAKTACLCITPWQWTYNAANLNSSCVCNTRSEITITPAPGCLDCTALPYATGTVTANVCNCKPNFLWNATALNCYCPASWYLNATTKTCTCPTVSSVVISGYCVNCTALANNNGPNSTLKICNCINPYQWNWVLATFTATCYCNSLT
jgi:hypothetical protein